MVSPPPDSDPEGRSGDKEVSPLADSRVMVKVGPDGERGHLIQSMEKRITGGKKNQP